MTRCFIGVFIPDGLKEKLLNLQNFIKSLDIDCKLVEAENMHLTLSFLGEIPEGEIPEISRKLDIIAQNFTKFSVVVSGILLIPNKNFIRVIALDVADEAGYLRNLVGYIGAEIGGDAKPPHLTLCRVRKIEGKHDTVDKLVNSVAYAEGFQVDSISLIKSNLSRSGSAYSTVHESRLK